MPVWEGGHSFSYPLTAREEFNKFVDTIQILSKVKKIKKLK